MPGFKLIWSPEALRDLEERAAWSQRQAARVVEAMNLMAEVGWSTGGGRRSHLWAHYIYLTVRPLGVVYEIVDQELHVLQVVDVRQLRQTP